MTQETVIPKKKRGPAATGKGTPVVVRLQPDDLDALDAHIATQPDKPSRPEAIRRVLAEKLGSPQDDSSAGIERRATKAVSDSADARSHASDAANVEMEGMDATAEEKTRRRKALTEKPPMVAKARAKRPRAST